LERRIFWSSAIWEGLGKKEEVKRGEQLWQELEPAGFMVAQIGKAAAWRGAKLGSDQIIIDGTLLSMFASRTMSYCFHNRLITFGDFLPSFSALVP
jgi:hypothetical protein